VTREVIGVVRAVKLNSIREEPVPTVFWPLAQPMAGPYAGQVRPVMLIRAAGDPEALVRVVRREMESAGLGPVACDVRTLTDRAADLLSGQRTIAVILSAVGLVGLLFVVTGICGVIAYEVTRRTREIGVRVALGAGRNDVIAWVLCKGAVLTGAGLVLGIGLSVVPMWILSRLLPEIQMWDAYFLYGVPMWDPLTYAGATLLLALAALIACWLPARRAARIDPMVALRYE
jgi:putative ABC transport system permease protein